MLVYLTGKQNQLPDNKTNTESGSIEMLSQPNMSGFKFVQVRCTTCTSKMYDLYMLYVQLVQMHSTVLTLPLTCKKTIYGK